MSTNNEWVIVVAGLGLAVFLMVQLARKNKTKKSAGTPGGGSVPEEPSKTEQPE